MNFALKIHACVEVGSDLNDLSLFSSEDKNCVVSGDDIRRFLKKHDRDFDADELNVIIQRYADDRGTDEDACADDDSQIKRAAPADSQLEKHEMIGNEVEGEMINDVCTVGDEEEGVVVKAMDTRSIVCTEPEGDSEVREKKGAQQVGTATVPVDCTQSEGEAECLKRRDADGDFEGETINEASKDLENRTEMRSCNVDMLGEASQSLMG